MADRIAFVTGAESGIGAACAGALAAAGFDVAVLYFKDQGAAETTASTVKAAGQRAVIVQADVSQEAAVEAAFNQVGEALGLPLGPGQFGGPQPVRGQGRRYEHRPVAAAYRQRLDRSVSNLPAICSRFAKGQAWRRDHQYLLDSRRSGSSGGGGLLLGQGGASKNLTETMALECAPLGISVKRHCSGDDP